jgi:hypothetical protein
MAELGEQISISINGESSLQDYMRTNSLPFLIARKDKVH